MAEDKAEFGEGFTQIDDDHNGHVSDEELGDFLRSPRFGFKKRQTKTKPPPHTQL